MLWLLLTSGLRAADVSQTIPPLHENPQLQAFLQTWCLDCHAGEAAEAGLSLTDLSQLTPSLQNTAWERITKRLRTRQMPPLDVDRPSEAAYVNMLELLEGELLKRYQAAPNPGRTETFRRLTRTEYQNAIRDLLALDIDAREFLPADAASHGFDNVTVGELSPTLLNRYISAARSIAGKAVGRELSAPETRTVRLPGDLTQNVHVAGLPLGTRGGTRIRHTFPLSGEYQVTARLMRDRNEHVEGLTRPHDLVFLLDRQKMHEIRIRPPKDQTEHATVDAQLTTRFRVTAGPHDVGVTFIDDDASLLQIKREPYASQFNYHRHPRQAPAIYEVTITGPYGAIVQDDSPSRRKIFTVRPPTEATPDEQTMAAQQILRSLMRRAFRRPVTEDDLVVPMDFFESARSSSGFEAGIELAVQSILVNPHFLFRIERDPPDLPNGSVYHIAPFELASRLSFFLWSSLPDEELLQLAEAGTLNRTDVLREQVARMLQDPRAESLVTNFADQWLYLRNLSSITPDARLFPDFDENLRRAFRKETELLFADVVNNDRSVLELIRSDETFLNERLAKHYGIGNVYGNQFRRVTLDAHSHRGGLLRHGSLLTVTSYATRTSPVIRGHWILKNLLGSPPPPPPPDVPDLEDNTVDATLSVRERLTEHRANPVCANCHNLMDPIGFALENFDAVGRWRDVEAGQPINASGELPDGSEFDSVDGLEAALLRRPELFVETLTSKLMTYALGRGMEATDGPAIRQIVDQAAESEYRFSSLVNGIVTSPPFLMRTSQQAPPATEEQITQRQR